jgi:hypothetical protein
VAYAWSDHVLWLQWMSPVVVFLGTIYFTNTALSGGQLSLPARALRGIKLKVDRLPWHVLKREGVLVLVAVATMAGWVYWHMKPVV